MQGYLKHRCAWCLLFRQASEQGEKLALVSSVIIQDSTNLYFCSRIHTRCSDFMMIHSSGCAGMNWKCFQSLCAVWYEEPSIDFLVR